MKKLIIPAALLSVLLFAPLSMAEDTKSEPKPVDPGAENEIEPQVTIKEGDSETVYEYRRGDHLIMVKVQPEKGPAYYFYDTDGDGELERHDEQPGDISIHQWVLFRW